jgi:hypothetical protein
MEVLSISHATGYKIWGGVSEPTKPTELLAGDIAGKPKKMTQYFHSLAGLIPTLYMMRNHEFYGHDFALDSCHVTRYLILGGFAYGMG